MNLFQNAPPDPREQRLVEGVVGAMTLLRSASPAQLGRVAREAWVLSLRRNDVVLARGGRVPGLFSVVYGSIKLALRAARGERVLRLVGPGQVFGEASALLTRPAPYDAHAIAESKLVVIPAAAIFSHIDSDPRSARAAIAALAARKLELLDELEAATLQDGGQRLARYLVGLAQAGGPRVRLPASKTVVAARLGMTKETLSRLLQRFALRGWIEVCGREVAVLEPDALARAAL